VEAGTSLEKLADLLGGHELRRDGILRRRREGRQRRLIANGPGELAHHGSGL
jgi:hypothetical protein